MKDKVFNLSEYLRSCGVESIVDIYPFESYHGYRPPISTGGDDLTHWLEWYKEQIEKSDCVLVAVSQEYYIGALSAEKRGGVSPHVFYELKFMRELIETGKTSKTRFIPIGDGHYVDNSMYIPDFILGETYFDISDEIKIQSLLRRIWQEFKELYPKINIFISYATEDYDVAYKIYYDLKKNDLIPWLDKLSLIPGQNWKSAINKAIKESDYFLALLSTNSVTKRGYIQKELKIAMDFIDELPSDEIFLIPVRLDNCLPIDEKLKNLHWVDLFESYEDGFNQILKAIKQSNIDLNIKEDMNTDNHQNG